MCKEKEVNKMTTTNTITQPKSWIINKNLTEYQLRAINFDSDTYWNIEKESEKAYLFTISTGCGHISLWCPKSQTVEVEIEPDYEDMTDEEKAEYDRKFMESMKAYEAKLNKGLEYNTKLKEYAIANGIKVYMKRRYSTNTLIAKIEEAGLAVPARA